MLRAPLWQAQQLSNAASATAFQRTFLDFPLRICCSCGRHSAEPTVEPMQIDIAQFHQAFLDESLENLDVMASGLLALDSNDLDLEDVNAIFGRLIP